MITRRNTWYKDPNPGDRKNQAGEVLLKRSLPVRPGTITVFYDRDNPRFDTFFTFW